MRGHDMVVVGASAGGVEALLKLVGSLPADLPAAVCVVLHLPSNGRSLLPELLNRAGPLPARHPEDGEAIKQGRIYVAPPDKHLVLRRGVLRLSRGPRENRARPAVDPLFRSAALAYGPRVVGVVLSGTLDDGTAGLLTIKERGGVAIVQDPADALFPGMPQSALEQVAVDERLPVAEIGPALVRLAGKPAGEEGGGPVSDELSEEVETAEFDPDELQDQEHPGTPSVFSCPECSGVLFEIQEGELTRYRCRVGHAYAVETLHAQQAQTVEDALWMALRALEEKADLTRRLLRSAEQRGLTLAASRYAEEVAGTLRNAAVIRRVLLNEPAAAAPAERSEREA